VRRLISLGAVLAASAFALTSCAGETTQSQGADLAAGKELFTQKCGQCHALQAAGTQGQIGPNLDHAFGYARTQDFDESTFFEVTLGQMGIPVPPMPDFDEEGTKDFLPEEDRIAIAAFVSQCAALEVKDAGDACAAGAGGGQQATDGESIFSQNCASCHTLQAAGASGTIGPNLDESSVTLRAAIMQIAEGGNGMPAFAGNLTTEQIETVARYIVENAR
jgi:mono/diheme cytochrome c family protein